MSLEDNDGAYASRHPSQNGRPRNPRFMVASNYLTVSDPAAANTAGLSPAEADYRAQRARIPVLLGRPVTEDEDRYMRDKLHELHQDYQSGWHYRLVDGLEWQGDDRVDMTHFRQLDSEIRVLAGLEQEPHQWHEQLVRGIEQTAEGEDGTDAAGTLEDFEKLRHVLFAVEGTQMLAELAGWYDNVAGDEADDVTGHSQEGVDPWNMDAEAETAGDRTPRDSSQMDGLEDDVRRLRKLIWSYDDMREEAPDSVWSDAHGQSVESSPRPRTLPGFRTRLPSVVPARPFYLHPGAVVGEGRVPQVSIQSAMPPTNRRWWLFAEAILITVAVAGVGTVIVGLRVYNGTGPDVHVGEEL